MDRDNGTPEVTPEAAKPVEDQSMHNFLHTVERYRGLKRGEVVDGVVVRVNRDEVLVDIGAKSDGVIRLQEIDGEKTSLGVAEGDRILVYVVQPENRDGGIVLSLARAQMERDWRAAQKLLDEGGSFEGEVVGFNKGGLLVRYGEVRAFVPASQVVELRGGDREQLETRLAAMMGRRLRLKVIEVDRTKSRLILSETAANREWRVEMRERLLSEIRPGETRRGRVTSVCDFGAFVDLGGIDGLVHVTELAWLPVARPSDVVSVGDEVDVYVVSVDVEKRRIALSVRRTQPEPWLALVQQYAPGQLVEATVTRLASFGAFARVLTGVEGLIHISELASERIAHPKQVVQVGDTVTVRILAIDASRHRLSLSLRQARQTEDDEAPMEGEPGE